MKKLVFIMPLMAVSLLTNCGCSKSEPTYTITFNCTNCEAYDEFDKEVKKVTVPASQYAFYYKFHFKGTKDYFSPVKSSIDVRKTNTEEKVDFTFDKSSYEILVPVNSDLTITASGLANPPLEDYTWAQIAEISASGKAEEYFDIYNPEKPDMNCKKVYLKGQKFPHTVRIIDFNHDTDPDGNPIGITFEFMDLITEGTTEPTGALTTVWDGTNNCDYRKSILNNFLNKEDDNNSVINRLPEELSEVIKPVDKLVGVNESQEESQDAYEPMHFSPVDEMPYPKLFPLAYEEITQDEYHWPDFVVTGEAGPKGTYEYYKNRDFITYSQKSIVNSDEGDFYWLRSPSKNNVAPTAGVFIIIGSGGASEFPPMSPLAIAPAFCI